MEHEERCQQRIGGELLNGLDLFTGIGGLAIALEEWVRPIAYCEFDPHAQAVLLSRMWRRELCRAPIWDDVRTLRLREMGISVPVDILIAGFPCQDISVAGNGRGLGGSRSGLFFEIVRIASELRPQYIFLENVPAITVRGLDRVLLELTALGYDCRWTIVSASEVGAKHQRDRFFLLANSGSQSLRLPVPGKRHQKIHASRTMEDGKTPNPNPNSKRVALRRTQVGLGTQKPFGLDLLEGDNWDEYARFLLRVDHGVPNRGHRLRGLGNAVVPLQARTAFQRLLGIEGGR